MSVVGILMVIWFGFLGFVAVCSIFSLTLDWIENELGNITYYVAIALIGMLLLHIGEWEKSLEKKAVEGFLAAWSDETKHGAPQIWDERKSWSNFIDWRLSEGDNVPNENEFVSRFPLFFHGSVREKDEVKMRLPDEYDWARKQMVRVKLFETPVTLLGSGRGVSLVKFWVASDSDKIIKMTFE